MKTALSGFFRVHFLAAWLVGSVAGAQPMAFPHATYTRLAQPFTPEDTIDDSGTKMRYKFFAGNGSSNADDAGQRREKMSRRESEDKSANVNVKNGAPSLRYTGDGVFSPMRGKQKILAAEEENCLKLQAKQIAIAKDSEAYRKIRQRFGMSAIYTRLQFRTGPETSLSESAAVSFMMRFNNGFEEALASEVDSREIQANPKSYMVLNMMDVKAVFHNQTVEPKWYSTDRNMKHLKSTCYVVPSVDLIKALRAQHDELEQELVQRIASRPTIKTAKTGNAQIEQ